MDKISNYGNSNYRNSKLINVLCEKHGIPLREFVGVVNCEEKTMTMCDKCAIEKRDKKLEEELKQEMINAKLVETYYVFSRQSIIPKEFENASFKNFRIENDFDETALNFAKRMANHYFKDGSGNTVLLGRPGLGKSHLALSMAKGLNETFKNYGQQKSVLFMPVSRLLK